MNGKTYYSFVSVVVCCFLWHPVSAEEVLREWTSAVGGHKITATLVGFQRGNVTLRKVDGQSLSISLTKLSVDDQKHVKESDFGIPPGEEKEMGGVQFVWCPPGTFLMGSPPNELGRQEDEIQHEVTLTEGFWIAKFECTQEQYERVTGQEHRSYPSDRSLPVNRVTWNQAVFFCQALNQLDDAIPEGWRARLPTEAQWEYACRAGSDAAYCFGDDLNELPEYAWYGYSTVKRRKGGYPEKVGTKRANQWGIHDMHGNVMEWCLDQYGDYSNEPQTNPTGSGKSGSSNGRVVRGGASDSGRSSSFTSDSFTAEGVLHGNWELRSAWRSERSQERDDESVGFRIVLVRDGTGN